MFSGIERITHDPLVDCTETSGSYKDARIIAVSGGVAPQTSKDPHLADLAIFSTIFERVSSRNTDIESIVFNYGILDAVYKRHNQSDVHFRHTLLFPTDGQCSYEYNLTTLKKIWLERLPRAYLFDKNISVASHTAVQYISSWKDGHAVALVLFDRPLVEALGILEKLRPSSFNAKKISGYYREILEITKS